MDERAAILAAKAGDQQAFADLFHQYYPMIHAYAYRLCLRPTDAQDIAQETFIKAARALRTYEPRTPFAIGSIKSAQTPPAIGCGVTAVSSRLKKPQPSVPK